MNKNIMWGLIVVALLIGLFIGYFVEKQRATDKMEATKMMMQKQIDDAMMKAKNDKETGAMMKKSNLVMMANSAKLGTYVTGANDMALYIYDKDGQNQSNCTGDCAKKWPPYTATGSVPSTLPEHMGTMKRADGSTQYTWDGKLLHYYSADKDKEDTYGDGIGGVWHIAK